MDISSAGALQRSFDKIANPTARRHLEALAVKAMHRAKYFCAGMLDIAKYQHYALNAPLYTHFTSPIRRYADILVHRQLDSVLTPASEGEIKFSMDRDSVAKVAQHCNMYVARCRISMCWILMNSTARRTWQGLLRTSPPTSIYAY